MTQTLRERIDSMLYERTALSRKPDKRIEKELRSLRDTELATPDLLMRDPYMLDFLGLQDTYLEDDIEYVRPSGLSVRPLRAWVRCMDQPSTDGEQRLITTLPRDGP